MARMGINQLINHVLEMKEIPDLSEHSIPAQYIKQTIKLADGVKAGDSGKPLMLYEKADESIYLQAYVEDEPYSSKVSPYSIIAIYNSKEQSIVAWYTVNKEETALINEQSYEVLTDD